MYPEPYLRTHLGKADQQWLCNPTARAILAVALAAILIAPSVQFCIKITKKETSLFRESGEKNRSALGRWMPTARLLTQSPPPQNPYGQGHWFPTPPFVLICLAPLSKLSMLGAAIVWSLLKFIGIGVALFAFVRAMVLLGSAAPVGVLLMAAVFSFRPVVSDIQHGNLNIFMLVWLAIAWVCYVRQRDMLAGIFVALAIVTKVTPALLLLYFIYKRQWRVCIGAVIGLVLLVLIIPGLYLGWSRNIEFLTTWFNMLVRPFAVDGYAALEIANQSLYGTLVRVLSNAKLLSVEQMPTEQLYQVGMEEMARPLTAMGRLLRPAISLGVLGSLAWICRGVVKRRSDPGLWLEFAMVLVAMLLLSERTWKHHATTLTLVYLIVWYCLTMYEMSDKFRAFFVGGLVVQLFLLVIGSEDLLGDELADRMLEGGFFCWGLLLCGIQAAVLRTHMRRVAA
jgi:alpha-1,2-mannosyltransferase